MGTTTTHTDIENHSQLALSAWGYFKCQTLCVGGNSPTGFMEIAIIGKENMEEEDLLVAGVAFLIGIVIIMIVYASAMQRAAQ